MERAQESPQPPRHSDARQEAAEATAGAVRGRPEQVFRSHSASELPNGSLWRRSACRADRQRHDARLKEAIGLERRNREKQLTALGDQIELVAVTLLGQLDDSR